MEFDFIPQSLALIPDGNRRWARMHRLSIMDGYNLGVKKFIDFAEWCKSYGINNLTVWALSSENMRRPSTELNVLFGIYRRLSSDRSILARLKKNNVKVNIVGNESLVPRDLYKSLKSVENDTADNTGGVINMLVGYGGKDDIVHAAKKLSELALKGYTVDESVFQKSLLSYQVPNIDFIIRTSGEKRLSGFMPWQTGYSELYFSSKLWPDFTRTDLHAALADYNRRNRRFGR